MTSKDDLHSVLWAAADLMRGAFQSDEAVNLLVATYGLKVISDSRHLFGELGYHIPDLALWPAIKQDASYEEGIRKALAALAEANPSLELIAELPFTVYRGEGDPRRGSALGQVVLQIDRLNLSAKTVGELQANGDLVHGLLARGASRWNRLDGWNTARELLDLMARLVDVQPGMEVYDPTCGAGGSFVAVANDLVKRGHDPGSVSFWGQDVADDGLFLCTFDLLLHGVREMSLQMGDILTDPRHLTSDGRVRQFDCILTEPPLGLLAPEDLTTDPRYGRFTFGPLSGRRADYAFIQHGLASLRAGGRMAIVTIPGVLFRAGFEAKIRQNLVHADVLESIIALPPGMSSVTSIPLTVLTFSRAKPARLRGKIVFIDATTNLSSLGVDTKERILEAVRGESDFTEFSHVADAAEVIRNDYHLLPSRYIARSAPKAADLDRLEQDIKELAKRQTHAAKAIEAALTALRELD